MENEGKINLRPGLIGSSITMAIALALSVWAWVSIPSGKLIPVHWSADGTPNGYMSRVGIAFFGLILLLVVDVFMIVLAWKLNRNTKSEVSTAFFTTMWMYTEFIMLIIHVTSVFLAFQAS